MPPFRVTHQGDRAIRVEFDAGQPGRAASLADAVRTNAPAWVIDAAATARVAIIVFDPIVIDPAAARSAVEAFANEHPRRSSITPRTHTIPACYHPTLAPDLESLAAELGMTPAELIELHASARYTVESLGFQPGFAYLAGLPEQLNAHRHQEPRPRVAAGSVGIAGNRTGVYPHATPGGWRLIARTNVDFFDPAKTPPALLAVGDTVRFVPITLDDFNADGAAG